MDGQTYEIKLNLNIDDSQLTNAERRIKNMENGRVGGSGGSRISGGGSYSNIPARQQGYYRLLNQRFGSTRGLSNEGFLGNVNRMYHRSDVFKRAFLGNLTSLPGMLRNLSNFGSVLGSIGKIAGGVVPALGAFASAFTKLGGVFLAYKGIGMAVSGGILSLGTKFMNSAAMTQAGSSLMQFQMARKGLGSAYEQSLNDATRLAAEYGFSRTGILNSINMLSGLNVGNRKLDRTEATRIATQAGKIAHVGGVPFERVNINLQQLLGQPVPSARDLRELIQAAPIIGKIAQQSMAKRNISGDVFTYLKDKSELLRVLNEFDQMIESNPLMRSKGRISLAKENFYIDIADRGSGFWEAIAKGNEKLFAALARSVGRAISKIDPEKLSYMFDSLADNVEGGINAIVNFFDTMGPILRGAGKAIGWTLNTAFGKGNWGAQTTVRLTSALGRVVTGNSPIFKYYLPQYNAETGEIEPGKPIKKFGRSWKYEDKSREAEFNAVKRAKEAILKDTNIPKYQWKSIIENKSAWTEIENFSSFFPKGFALNPEFANPVAELDPNANNIATSDGLSDITKGARALIINFNREIVSMPISIDNVNDGTDLGSQLQGSLYDNIVRGLQIALNNSTGAM